MKLSNLHLTLRVFVIGRNTSYKIREGKVGKSSWINDNPVSVRLNSGDRILVVKEGTNSECQNAGFLKMKEAFNFRQACFPS